MRRGLRLGAALVAGAVTAVIVPGAAFASTAPTDGGDVSRKQETQLPPVGAFAIVALNTGLPTETNPYLAPQLAWAATATDVAHHPTDLYLASANPGLAAAWWPGKDVTKAGKKVTPPAKYHRCTAKKATVACAWVYGNSIGRDDVHRIGSDVTIGRWWIDLEGGPDGNTWSSSTARNRAVVEGMIAGLTAGNKRVGLYSASSHFREILGTVPSTSPIARLPFWAAGATSRDAALSRCAGSSLTSGRLTLVQWTEAGTTVDHDVLCGVLTQPKPKVSGTVRVGHRLTARAGTWGPAGVHLTYRWTRDGHPIAKATHRTYTLKKADAHHRIGVTVTGTETGYSKAVQRSTTHRIAS